MAGKKKHDQPSVRERRLVDGVVRGQAVKTAALVAGYAPSTASSNAYLILDRPRVRSLLTDALERAGFTPDKLAAPLLDALEAKVRIVNPRTMEAAETDYADHTTRLAAADRIMAAYGVLPRKVEMPDPPAPGLVVNIQKAEELGTSKEIPDADGLPPLVVNISQQPESL